MITLFLVYFAKGHLSPDPDFVPKS
jgi:hypothetical protein